MQIFCKSNFSSAFFKSLKLTYFVKQKSGGWRFLFFKGKVKYIFQKTSAVVKSKSTFVILHKPQTQTQCLICNLLGNMTFSFSRSAQVKTEEGKGNMREERREGDCTRNQKRVRDAAWIFMRH